MNLISCDENYPKTVTLGDGSWDTDSRYEIDINSFEEYLIEKIEKTNFEKSEFSYGYISSNKSINENEKIDNTMTILYRKDSKENAEIDTKYNFSVYSIGFEFSD